MNRIHTAISAAILASSMVGGVALAGDKAQKQQAGEQQTMPATPQNAPAGTDGSTGAAGPDIKDLDTNAQRAHQPQGGAGGADSSSGGSAAATGSAGADPTVAASGETRDWAQIDANNDNLISPEEMEQALKATGPQAGEKR